MSEKSKKWLKAAGVRALKTVAQSAISVLTMDTIGLLDVDWIALASVAGMAGLISLLTSVAGLPEVNTEV